MAGKTIAALSKKEGSPNDFKPFKSENMEAMKIISQMDNKLLYSSKQRKIDQSKVHEHGEPPEHTLTKFVSKKLKKEAPDTYLPDKPVYNVQLDNAKKEEAEQVDEAWPGTDEYKKKFPDTKRFTGRGDRHDIESTSTGVKATRRYSTDDTTEKPENAPKRGRGRPKKDKFAEAVDFLMSVNEDQFEELIAEGFDSFFEAYERAVTK